MDIESYRRNSWALTGIVLFALALFTVLIGYFGAGHGGPLSDPDRHSGLEWATCVAVTVAAMVGSALCFRAAFRKRDRNVE